MKSLEGWFERQKRVLPWRDAPTLYRVWVSEIMLQQTQVATVIPYFERFLARFPTVEALAAASPDDVLLHWAGLGYYSRARNLHRAAALVVQAGGFPRTREGWLALPGVGNYTAGAILSIALDQPEAILDGNVERVLSRLRRVNRAGGDAVYKERLWELARDFVQGGQKLGIRPSVLNQALMELGATVCSPRRPRCGECPLAGDCAARAEDDAEAYPPRKKPKEWIQVKEELHCVLDGRGRVLLRKRAPGEWRAGLWDLLDRKPARAEWVEEIETKHVVTRHKITRRTQVWRLRPAKNWKAAEASAGGGPPGEPGDLSGELRWVSLESPEVAVGSALKRVFASLADSVVTPPKGAARASTRA